MKRRDQTRLVGAILSTVFVLCSVGWVVVSQRRFPVYEVQIQSEGTSFRLKFVPGSPRSKSVSKDEDTEPARFFSIRLSEGYASSFKTFGISTSVPYPFVPRPDGGFDTGLQLVPLGTDLADPRDRLPGSKPARPKALKRLPKKEQ